MKSCLFPSKWRPQLRHVVYDASGRVLCRADYFEEVEGAVHALSSHSTRMTACRGLATRLRIVRYLKCVGGCCLSPIQGTVGQNRKKTQNK